MKDKKPGTRKAPDYEIDKSLEKYLHQPLFQKKLDEANKTIKEVGLPDIKKKKS